MELKLKKPIVFFDLETTGVDVATDRIIEISMLKVGPNGSEETKTRRVNPGRPIPAESTAIHGISDEDVKDAPTFKQLAKDVDQFIEGCDLAGYNSNKFDIPILAEELLRAGIRFSLDKREIIDVQVIFHKMEQRTLAAAYQFYCGRELTNAHTAEADTLATYEVLKAQLDKYGELENDVHFLGKFSTPKKFVDLAGRFVYNKKGEEVFNFGKHKGKKVEDVLKQEPGYFGWMMQGDFPLYTKEVLKAIRLRAFNKGNVKGI
jgi:DNA polymerase-3 subunit epsilon